MRLKMRRRRHQGQVELNVIPLIDVVFFLLVFYVISTSFISESAVTVQRPASSQASAISNGFVPVAITKGGAIQIGAQILALSQLGDAVSIALKQSGHDRVLVIPDRDVPTGLLLAVMDRCSAAGATSVDVAATREGAP